jgi:hypothetical protein
MSVVLIAELHCSRHRMQYVHWIAQGALLRGHKVRLATLEHCLDHTLYAATQRECSGRVEVDVLPGEKNLRSKKLIGVHRTAYLVRQVLKLAKPNRISLRSVQCHRRQI